MLGGELVLSNPKWVCLLQVICVKRLGLKESRVAKDFCNYHSKGLLEFLPCLSTQKSCQAAADTGWEGERKQGSLRDWELLKKVLSVI